MAKKPKKSPRKRSKTYKSQKRKHIDLEKIERLVSACLESKYKMPWYRPDNVNSIPHWDEIVEAFYGGYDFALRAALKALQGDDGQALENNLNGDVLITRPEDRAERDAKIEEGAPMMHFRSRAEAEAFLKALGIESESEETPLECLN